MRTSDLRKICQKGEGELFLISAYAYRPFTIYFSHLYILFHARSNTITFHSLVAGIIAAGLVLNSAPVYLLAAAFFLQIYFVLDHVDGEVARYNIHSGREKASLAGEFFDSWTHYHTVNVLFATMGLGMFQQTGNILWAILGLIGCNISGNFNRMPAANVILCALARQQLRIDNAKLAPILDVCCGISERQRLGRRLPVSKRVRLAVSEFLIFPGNVIALTAVLLADGFFSFGHTQFHLFRGVYLFVYCGYGLLAKTARTIVNLRQFKAISAKG